jgi:NAD(P)-dependent dehydrogenase (short-subunit alcohol dehydrogenase family)
MSSTGVILIIGAGAGIGNSTASKFASNGYKVALASRSAEDGGFSPEGYFNIKADLSDPSIVSVIYEKVERALGLPNVVVFNGKFFFFFFHVLFALYVMVLRNRH